MREDGIPWISEPTRRDSGSPTPPEQVLCPAVGQNVALTPHLATAGSVSLCTPTLTMTPCPPPSGHARSVSVSAVPLCDGPDSGDYFPFSRMGRIHSSAATPPITPPSKRRGQLKAPRTPPPPSRTRLAQLLPNITLTRSKSHESQLANRIEEPNSKYVLNKTTLCLWCVCVRARVRACAHVCVYASLSECVSVCIRSVMWCGYVFPRKPPHLHSCLTSCFCNRMPCSVLEDGVVCGMLNVTDSAASCNSSPSLWCA